MQTNNNMNAMALAFCQPAQSEPWAQAHRHARVKFERQPYMGMYCKKCEYDLRSQESPRCPECGTEFNPYDSTTFLDRTGGLYRLGVWLGAMRIPLIVLLTCLWVFYLLGGPQFFMRVRDGAMLHPPALNLKMITYQWNLWQKADPTIRNFDRSMALRDLPTMLGTYVKLERKQRRWRISWAGRVIPYYAGVTAIYSLPMIPLLQRRRRRIALGVLLACMALIPVSIGASKLAAMLFPEGALPAKSYAYLGDYVYINGVHFTPPDGGNNKKIVAYGKKIHDISGTRCLAFDDGSVWRIHDDRAVRKLFKAQGLEYPMDTIAEASE